MRIQQNILALNASNRLKINNKKASSSLERLSSGLRINRSADDAAGLAISEKMKAQIRGLNQAQRNVQDAISLLQTAEGALTESHAILQRMRELAIQASNGTACDGDRQMIQDEVYQLKQAIDEIPESTEFNSMKLLDGTYCGINNIVSTGTYSRVVGGVFIGIGGSAITAGVNDTLTFNVDGVANAIILNAGHYNSTSLLDEINSKFSSANVDLTASYSEGTYGYLVLTHNIIGASHTVDNISGNAASSLFIYKQNGYTSTFNVQGWTDLYPSVTITSGLNDTLTFEIDGLSRSITIASGTYDTSVVDQNSAFVQAIDSALNNAGIQAKAYIVGVVGDATDPLRILRLSFKETEGAHTFGNVGGNARSTLMDRIQLPLHSSTDSSNTINGDCYGYSANYSGNIDLSSGLTITSGQNDTLNITVDGIMKTLTLNSGIYDSASLLTEIDNQLTNVGVNITATFSGNYLKLTHNLTGETHTIDDITGSAVSSLLITTINGTDAIIEYGQDINLQVGANEGELLRVNISDMRTNGLGINNISVSTQTDAEQAISTIDIAIAKVSSERSKMGAIQNTLEHIKNNLANYEENITASESRIRDADMAKEIMEYTKNNILMQTTQALLAQANQVPQAVLQLLR